MSSQQVPEKPSEVPLEAELQQAELRKRTLECRKLEKEIKEQTRPWWTRTAYLAVFVPTLVAVLGFIQAFRSGYFDVQALRQEVRERELKLQKRDVEDQEKALANRKVEITQLQAQVETTKKTLSTQLQEAQKQYDAKLARTQAAYDAQSKVLTEKAELAPVNGYLDGVFKNTYPSVETEAPLALIRILQQNDAFQAERIKLVKDAVEGPTGSPSHKAVLLFVLYAGSHDRIWRNRLFDLVQHAVRAPPGSAPPYGVNSASMVLQGISHSWWPEADQTDVAVFVANLLDTPVDELRFDLVWVYFEIYKAGRSNDDFRKNHLREYILATATARDEYLKSINSSGMRLLKTGAALQALAPQGFLTATAKLLTTPTARNDQTFAAELLGKTSYISSGSRQLDNKTYPHSVNPEEWDQWIKSNSQLTSLWLEPSLKTFRDHPETLETALGSWLSSPRVR
jgi:hypothetical protein